MTPTLIGLNGKKGSGKNVAGDFLATMGYRPASYAALLKESIAALFGTSVAAWEDWKNDETARVVLSVSGIVEADLTCREMLQRYGTEAHRDVFGYPFWVEAAFASLTPGLKYAFTDARFDNELLAIRERGGFNIRIERPGLDAADTHASEADPSPGLIDAYVSNDGTIEDLGSKLRGLLETF